MRTKTDEITELCNRFGLTRKNASAWKYRCSKFNHDIWDYCPLKKVRVKRVLKSKDKTVVKFYALIDGKWVQSTQSAAERYKKS